MWYIYRVKTSKNSGLTKSCPSCRKTIIKSINFSGSGTMEMKCPHCGSHVSVELGQRSIVTIRKKELPIAISIIAIVILGGAILYGTVFSRTSEYAGEPSARVNYGG